MSFQEIHRIKTKFILAALTVIFGLLLFLGLTINLINYASTQRNIKQTLDELINKPIETERKEEFNPNRPINIRDTRLKDYYIILIDENNKGTLVETSFNHTLDNETVENISNQIFDSEKETGQYGNFYYKYEKQDSNIKLVLFDGTDIITSRVRLMTLTCYIFILTFVISALIIYLLSNKIIEAEKENIERQKEFITNASHELKTPLAVINANLDVLAFEIDDNENEWIVSSKQQIAQMTSLITNLIQIAKAEEKENFDEISDIDLTDLTKEITENFKVSANQQKKKLTANIQENIKHKIRESSYRQLLSIFLDNAVKYCDEDGEIEVILENPKKPKLTVSNTYKEGKDINYNKFFDRFYRSDESHTGSSFGIGLNIAESICKQNNIKLTVGWKDGKIEFTCQM